MPEENGGNLVVPRNIPAAGVWGLLVVLASGGFYVGTTLKDIQKSLEALDLKIMSSQERTRENKEAIRSLEGQIEELQRYLRRVGGGTPSPFDPAAERASAHATQPPRAP